MDIIDNKVLLKEAQVTSSDLTKSMNIQGLVNGSQINNTQQTQSLLADSYRSNEIPADDQTLTEQGVHQYNYEDRGVSDENTVARFVHPAVDRQQSS